MTGIDELLALIVDGKWTAVAAIVIGAIVRLLKDDTKSLPTVPAQWRPWLALGLGAVWGVLQAVVAGTPWKEAIVHGLTAALTAIAGHDLLIGSLRDGREIGAPPRAAERPAEQVLLKGGTS